MLYNRIRASNKYSYLLKNVRAVIEKLGHERISKVKIVGNPEVEQSLYGQVVLGMSSDMDEQLATEARKAGRTLIPTWLPCICYLYNMLFSAEGWVLMDSLLSSRASFCSETKDSK